MAKDAKPEVTDHETVEDVQRGYRQIDRMLKVSLAVVLGLAAMLFIVRPDGYLPFAIFLVLVELVSYPLLSRSLKRRRDDRIREIEAGE